MIKHHFDTASKSTSKRYRFEFFFLLFVFLISGNRAVCQKFIPIDDDVMEFIPEVSFDLFYKKQLLQTGLTSRDTLTVLDAAVVFDSIHFRKEGFRSKGFLKDSLPEVVFLQKEVFELDEVVLNAAVKKETFLGENSRFVRKRSNSFETEPTAGIVFFREELATINVTKFRFFVEKVSVKTNYKIKFYACELVGSILTQNKIKIGDVFFESPVLQLEKGVKNEVIVDLESVGFPKPKSNLFVVIELVSYEDETGDIINPEPNKQTKLKYQLSKKMNYFAKMMDITTKSLTPYFININAMIRRDFNIMFKKTPHRSNLVTPAISLYGTRVD
ncbi:hypothetical protein [Flavobacterium aurantiibacter]|nr:hypothetical protein [Flavobacterium aurantiibacter]